MYADGLLRVRGGDWRDTRVTVVPEYGDPFEVPLSSDHFDLDMGLESSYLLRAVQVGCAAKEIIFDLRVPVAYRSQVFHFPFEILLEVFKPDEEPYAYAQPVGAVFFDASTEDFVYTTDHRRISLARSMPTLIERMGTHISLHPNPENALAGYEALFDQDLNAGPLPALPVAVAIRDSLPNGKLQPGPIADHAPAIPAPARAEPTTAMHGTKAPAFSEHQSSPAVLPVAMPLAESRISTHFALEPSRAQLAMHEFQKLPTMYIRIDRFGNADHTMELRKVTHAYGAVFYFQDGLAITRRAYEEEFAKHVGRTTVVEGNPPGRP